MKIRLLRAATMIAAILAVSLLPAPAAGQTPAAAVTSWTGPRTPDGQPDVQGTWDAVISGSFSLVTPMAGGGRFNALATGRELPKNPSRIVDPPDGRVPYQPWAAALQQTQEKDVDHPTRPWHIDPQNRCLPHGVARGFYTTQARILQFPGQVVFFFQQYQYYRIIRLGAQHIGPDVKLWMGDPVGRWEGDTLVADVTNLNGKARLAMVGDFYSENAHVVERYTFTGADRLTYTATFDDPTVYTRPWTMAVELKRRPNEEFWEYGCHEGDRGEQLQLWPSEDGTYKKEEDGTTRKGDGR